MAIMCANSASQHGAADNHTGNMITDMQLCSLSSYGITHRTQKATVTLSSQTPYIS